MKILYRSILLLSLIIASSCEDKIDEFNVNPDSFPKGNEPQMLSGALGHISYLVDVDLNYTSQLWAQYFTWGIGVSIGNQERFASDPSDNNLMWERAYAGALVDLQFLERSESPAYRGVGRALQAYVFQAMVDHFGDVPYADALQGEIADGNILAPHYDDAGVIYDSLVILIDKSLADLEEGIADEDAVLVMADDDFVYGGDLEQWVKFANSLKLRILLRTSEVESNEAAIEELLATGTFIEAEDDIAQVAFSTTSGNQNPMWARMSWGVGDFYFASNATLDLLDNLNDPRGTEFYDVASSGAAAGSLRGINQGTIDDEPFTAPASDYSGSSAFSVAQDAPVILMSSWEVWFLRAEALARYGGDPLEEEAAFITAIESNFDYLGATIDSYAEDLGYDPAASLDTRLDMIGIQKWISMNGTQEDEGWIEARRFDRPASRIFTGPSGIWQDPPLSVLPDRSFPMAWLYPATERSLNANAPAQRTLTDQIFWDN
jgi:hypothetical protein